MSTIEDFENAPVGATATDADGGRAMKIGNDEWSWVTPNRGYLVDEGMVYWGYVLDPSPATAAREALDLAWVLAHEVKPGQVIPKGTRYLEVTGTGVKVYSAMFDFEVSPKAPALRTVDPFPDPEPDWLDAPAVLAHCGHCSHGDYGPQITLHGPAFNRQKWECAECQTTTDWGALSQVTPLYPKEGEEK